MTDEELHAAQPAGAFKFMLNDSQMKIIPREVEVPNWIARDGHWGDVYNALIAARDSNMATATEKIVKALERAREFGYQQATAMNETVRSVVEREYDKEFRERVEKAEERLRARGQL